MDSYIAELKKESHTIDFENKKIRISYTFFLTMVDGKIVMFLTDTSSAQKCTICSANPTDINQLQNFDDCAINEEAMEYGISPLHAYIRFMELVLHISYRLDLERWRVNEKDPIFIEKMKFIQREFKQKLGFIIDVPRPQGRTSNDGNTARKFFNPDNNEAVSNITGFNTNLLENFGTILTAINSGYKIHPRKFNEFAKQTSELYINKYPWYYMPASVHKILIHGAKIIENLSIPMGKLTEEAQEARNKEIRKLDNYIHESLIERVKT